MRLGISPRSAGLAAWTRSGSGRSRTAGTSPGGSSGRWWRPGSGSFVWRRTGWASPAKGSASRGSLIRSTRSRSRAVVKDGVEEFPVAYLNEQAMEIRLLLDHRNDLVAERTRTVNRLRWHLVIVRPELERSVKPGAFNQARELDRVDRQLRKLPAGARVRTARELIARIRQINRQVDELRGELLELVKAHRPQLLAELGCGPLVAAILIGHTAGAKQFRSDASFAMLAGAAPIPCSSGKTTQHRLNRGGDRQLNHALHIIAITRASHDPTTKQYLARKKAEGKTTKGGLRSLKRALARRFYHLLTEPPADQQQTAELAAELELPAIPERPRPRGEVQQIDQAPSPMACIN